MYVQTELHVLAPTYSGGPHLLEIATVRTDADLEDMIRVQALVRPDWRPKLENLRHNLESNPHLSYFVGRLGEEAVACGFVEP